MAMNTGFSDDDDDAVMSEINMTPLVDVMLVLLIIFLVTIPAMQHAVKIDLPHASSQPVDEKPQPGIRRQAPGGGVRREQQTHLLQVGHYVPDCRRRQRNVVPARQRARCDRLAGRDEFLDDFAKYFA